MNIAILLQCTQFTASTFLSQKISQKWKGWKPWKKTNFIKFEIFSLDYSENVAEYYRFNYNITSIIALHNCVHLCEHLCTIMSVDVVSCRIFLSRHTVKEKDWFKRKFCKKKFIKFDWDYLYTFQWEKHAWWRWLQLVEHR